MSEDKDNSNQQLKRHNGVARRASLEKLLVGKVEVDKMKRKLTTPAHRCKQKLKHQVVFVDTIKQSAPNV